MGCSDCSLSSTSVGESVDQRGQDVRQASRAWEKQARALVLIHVRDLASIGPTRGDLAWEARLQEQKQGEEDSWGPPSLV